MGQAEGGELNELAFPIPLNKRHITHVDRHKPMLGHPACERRRGETPKVLQGEPCPFSAGDARHQTAEVCLKTEHISIGHQCRRVCQCTVRLPNVLEDVGENNAIRLLNRVLRTEISRFNLDSLVPCDLRCTLTRFNARRAVARLAQHFEKHSLTATDFMHMRAWRQHGLLHLQLHVKRMSPFPRKLGRIDGHFIFRCKRRVKVAARVVDLSRTRGRPSDPAFLATHDGVSRQVEVGYTSLPSLTFTFEGSIGSELRHGVGQGPACFGWSETRFDWSLTIRSLRDFREVTETRAGTNNRTRRCFGNSHIHIQQVSSMVI